MIRLLDIVFSVSALIILAPVLLIVALAVRLETPGSPLFRQVRIGRGAKPFKINKFRSMVVNAPQLGGFSTSSGDARVTKVGRIIRATSLDELPQLWNVLNGDMSIVGPRPDVPQQEALYSPEQWRRRTSVRPGVTGLAQVTKRSQATHEERLEKDLEYVDNRSVGLYLEIMLSTGKLVVTKLAH